MKLVFKQRLFSWFDSYDIYDENDNTVFYVKGQFAWGHRLNVYDVDGNHIATLQEKVFTILPRFEVYINGQFAGVVSKEFSFFKPKFNIDYMNWRVEGSFMEWDYSVYNDNGICVASVTKELFNWSDTYIIDVEDSSDALPVLMLVLAIDAEKCSRND